MILSRRRRLAPALLLGVAIITAGCTEQAEVPAASPAPPASGDTISTTTPETIPVATDPVDDVAATTEVTTTEVTTTVASTTTIAASGIPSGVSTEFFAGSDPDGWLYLGRWTGAAWEAAFGDGGEVREPTIAVDTDVLVHELDLAPIPGTSGTPADACPGGRLGPMISPNPGSPAEPGFGYRSVAFAADWQTRPRPVAAVEAEVAAYVAAGIAAFDDSTIDASAGAVQQIVVADLDGDGDAESLVAFDGVGFSALLLIDADTGRSLTVSRDFAADVAAPDNTTYRTVTVADLNGDGLMEFVEHQWQGASAAVVVNTYDGTEVTAVLSESC